MRHTLLNLSKIFTFLSTQKVVIIDLFCKSYCTVIAQFWCFSLKVAYVLHSFISVGAGPIWTARRSLCGQCVGIHMDTPPESIWTLEGVNRRVSFF